MCATCANATPIPTASPTPTPTPIPTPTPKARPPEPDPRPPTPESRAPEREIPSRPRWLPMTISLAAVAAGAIVAFQIGPRISSSAHVPAPPGALPRMAVELAPPPLATAVPLAALVADGLATPGRRAVPRRAAVAVAPPVALPSGAFVHPLPGPVRHLPLSHEREFGAQRPGDRDPECGAGHCGVDLGRDIGTPVLAVRGGSVAKVVRNPDNRGGRWIQIKHPDGVSSYYMHLDRVRSDLRPGVDVAPGEPIGTLGRSGIRNSAPHLHFAMSTLDDSGETHFDPLPLLRDAALIDPPPVYHDPADDAALVADPAAGAGRAAR